MTQLYLIAAALIGAAFATQPAIDAVSAKLFGSAISETVLSVAITLAASVLIMLLTRATPTPAMVTPPPRWVVLGGLIGVLVVTGGAAIAAITGAAMFLVCLIAGPLAASVALDHIGAFGLQVREISVLRAVGALLAFTGGVLVRFG